MSEPIALEPESQTSRSWVYLGLLVAAHAVFNLVSGPFEGPETFPRLMTFGVVFSQLTLFATWLALGPAPAMFRIPLTIGAFLVTTTCVSVKSGPGSGDLFLVFGGFFGFWSLLLVILSRLLPWRIGNPRFFSEDGAVVNQFSVKHLLMLMTICAVLLGLGRMWAIAQSSKMGTSPGRFLENVIAPIGFISLAMIPAVVVPLFVITRPPSARAMAVLVPAWAALTWLAVQAILALARGAAPGGGWKTSRDVIALQLGAALAGIASASVVRYCGYRLIRRGGRSTAPTADLT